MESVEGEPQATFYLDPYARPGQKRGGAWMNSALPRSAALAPDGQERMLPGTFSPKPTVVSPHPSSRANRAPCSCSSVLPGLQPDAPGRQRPVAHELL